MEQPKKQCPICNHDMLCYGSAASLGPHTFVPARKLMVTGYQTEAFVCLSCGYVGHFLSEQKLSRLKSQIDN